MPPTSNDPPFTCVTCEAPVAGRPTFHVGLPFCCAGCVAGGPCTCSYDDEVVVRKFRFDARDQPAVMVVDDVRRMAGARG
jgi:hypothetical protein